MSVNKMCHHLSTCVRVCITIKLGMKIESNNSVRLRQIIIKMVVYETHESKINSIHVASMHRLQIAAVNTASMLRSSSRTEMRQTVAISLQKQYKMLLAASFHCNFAKQKR